MRESKTLNERQVEFAVGRSKDRLEAVREHLAAGNLPQALYYLLSAAAWLSSRIDENEGPGTFTYKIDKLRHEALHRVIGDAEITSNCCEVWNE